MTISRDPPNHIHKRLCLAEKVLAGRLRDLAVETVVETLLEAVVETAVEAGVGTPV
jgi:hypothetical protein